MNIKRLSLALVALGLSAPAFADSTVLVPSQHGGFKIGVDALYLRANGSDLGYASNVTFGSDTTTPPSLGSVNNASVDPSYDWGVYAQVGYLFPCTGNDLTFGYTHLNTNNNNSDSIVAATPTSTTFTNGIAVIPLSELASFNTDSGDGLFGSARGKSDYTLNVGDLEVGQRFTTGSYDLRMFAGLRYAKLDTSLKTFAQPFPAGTVVPVGDTVNTTVSGFQSFHSEYKGLGPRIGVDARYCLSSGFGLDADLSTSLLVGRIDSSRYNASVTDTLAALSNPEPPPATIPNPSFGTSYFTSTNGSHNRVVPVLEAKLGADYTWLMDCRCKSALVFEAGYQVTNYFNVSDVHSQVIVPNAGTVVGSGSTGDVAFDGPYLGLKYYA